MHSSIFFSLLKSPPIQLILCGFIVTLWGHFLPIEIARGIYTASLLFKDLLLMVLPAAIMAFIAFALRSFEKKALLFVLFLACFEIFSNSSSVLFAYGVSHILQAFFPVIETATTHNIQDLAPYWTIDTLRPSFWRADNAVWGGVLLGMLCAYRPIPIVEKMLIRIRVAAGWLFSKVFARLIPLYATGFLIQMQHSGVLAHILSTYANVLLMLLGALTLYLGLIILVAGEYRWRAAQRIFSTIFPTGVIAFSSMSSAATMPFTIAAAEKNMKDPAMAGMIIPATTNVQQVGDCLANAFLCLVILKTFGHSLPDFSTWLVFLSVFVLARFTTVGVLGGAIFIMIPIYEQYLGFSKEMVALILALNVVLDPFITASNVLGNGALCIILERWWMRLSALFFSTKHPSISS